MKFGNILIGKRLFVGFGKPKALGKGKEEIRGSAYVEGPLQIGQDTDYDSVEATLMVGAEYNTDSETHPDNAIKAKGDVEIEGDTNQTGNITASENITTNAHFIGDITQTSGTPPGCKLFDIQHPTKDGHRLAHACIEGPEIAVYTRGRVCNGKNVIDLPAYWDGLVDYETVTVQLTALGAHQNVIVKRISPMERKIYLQSQGGMPVDCFYHIMAQRKDVPNLVVEYEGKTPADYPGDNTGYSIAGYNYDVRS
tara:strand:+ start:1083 stop:1841 length:759 start_codon:yes stop_codon:yes gene_type:complete